MSENNASTDIAEFLERGGVKIEAFLSKGGYGSVSRGLMKVGDEGQTKPVAIKIIDFKEGQGERQLFRELEIAETVWHKNLTFSLFSGYYEPSDSIFIVTELYEEDFSTHLTNSGRLRPSMCKKMFRHITEGVAYLHQNGIAHRDIKLSNILLRLNEERKPLKAVLTDFGFSRRADHDTLSENYCGTRSYMAPELINETPYQPFIADCWSLGLVLFIIVTMRRPFPSSLSKSTMLRRQRNMKNLIPDREPFCSHPDLKALTLALMDADAETRITAEEALTYEWYKIPERQSQEC